MSIPAGFRKLAGRIVDWIFPPVCVSCGASGALLCEECRSKLQPVEPPFCPKCGKPLRKGKPCRLCGKTDFRFTASRAPYIYEGPAAALIKALKYNGDLSLVPILSGMLLDLWPELHWEIDLIVPVPLSEKRRAQRGFNQSELIAADFSRRIGVPKQPRALVKVRHTAQQVGLNADERRQNLSGAFAAEGLLVRGKRILLLDDVMTTGTTFAECSAVLLDAGAGSVHCLSAATAALGHGPQSILNTV